jgi:hypothetical protein
LVCKYSRCNDKHTFSCCCWCFFRSKISYCFKIVLIDSLDIQLSEEPNPLLQPLVDALKHIRNEGQQTPVSEAFDLKALIGEDRMRRYYRYDGSLTTPPCYESVIWTVLVEPIKLSFHQLHEFRYLHDSHAKLIQNTYRKIQPLGTRKLFRSFHAKDLQEDIKQKMASAENNGQNLKNNMKLLVVLASLLMIVF